MWSSFFHIFEECIIQSADVLQSYKKKLAKKRNTKDFLKSRCLLLSDRGNIIYSLFWEAFGNFTK